MNTKRGSHATQSTKGKTDWAKLKAMPDAASKFTKDAPRTSLEEWMKTYTIRNCPFFG